MTRKDYEMLAGVLRQQVTTARTLRDVEAAIGGGFPITFGIANTVEGMAYNLVQHLVADNERFDHLRFYEAAGFKVEGNYPRVFDTEVF